MEIQHKQGPWREGTCGKKKRKVERVWGQELKATEPIPQMFLGPVQRTLVYSGRRSKYNQRTAATMECNLVGKKAGLGSLKGK